ncbi:MAG TPA: cobalamin biosynthesis protein CobW [Lachnospiraceae bacterium]|nr:cobalamin biosynthesis protein CobW [Lachnospiraceae bacterium]
MAKIDIISGFLGAGKTTLIKKLIAEAFQGEKLVIIENEFGEIGIDGGFLKESGIQITEMNSGCICCSLVGDFSEALKEVLEKYSPDRVIIEPSGVGKLSDVVKAVKNTGSSVEINSTAVVVDASKCKMYMKNYGEFYNNQIEYAGTIILSRTQKISDDKLNTCLKLIREKNEEASVITTPWDDIDGRKILEAMEKVNSLEKELVMEHGHHHHHEDGEECHCHEHGHEGHHHHHADGEECHCHEHGHEGHHHHHADGEECHCHEHGHEGHHHHHADEVFTSWGIETAHKFTEEELKDILNKLSTGSSYGEVLRAKGIVAPAEGKWFHFDLVPEETELRRGTADFTGRVCVIGSKLDENAIKELFHVI